MNDPAVDVPNTGPGEPPTVERSVELAAPVDVVWSALTEDDALSSWFGGRVTLDPVPGGAGTFVSDDGATRRARVDEVEDGRRLAWRWWVDGDDDGPITSVTFELTDLGEVTRLVVTERPLLLGTMHASASAHVGGVASDVAGWTIALLALARRCLALARV
jgi:uncharacterized protein YndB with AHSA1/START domain